jgi:hypothetical protein
MFRDAGQDLAGHSPFSGSLQLACRFSSLIDQTTGLNKPFAKGPIILQIAVRREFAKTSIST